MLYLCFGGRSDLAGLDARCRRGFDQGRDDDNAHVQRNGRRELQGTQPLMRQPRRARRERIEIKHDERSRKAGTGGV